LGAELLRTGELDGRARYQLLTSLVVPRPIGWLSTRDASGGANLAPFSYFGALASSPMLVGVSVGHRGGEPKDSLRNIRHAGAFCVNVVTEALLEAMNQTAGEFAPDVDEFERAGLEIAAGECVDVPYVASCPAVLECRLHREVELGDAPNTLVVGRVEAVRLDERLRRVPGSHFVDAESLRPVGRLYGGAYGLLGEILFLDRPGSD